MKARLDGRFKDLHAEFVAAGCDRSRLGVRRKSYNLRKEVGYMPEGPTREEAVWTEPELAFLRAQLDQPVLEVIDTFFTAGFGSTRPCRAGSTPFADRPALWGLWRAGGIPGQKRRRRC